MADELLVRRKRVNPQGEWEYECVSCENWLDKREFRGCKVSVDAYGNCLKCMSCKAKETHQVIAEREKNASKEILEAIGFYQYPNAEEWFKAMKIKHNL